MTDDINPGDPILFMKVGTHANEDLKDIVERKLKEIEGAGFSMWGYGGNTLHPRTMVQPFGAANEASGRVIRLVMHPMTSRHFAVSVRAEEYSVDGIEWAPVPEAINVIGSRYALCVKNLRQVETSVRLNNTRVAIGLSAGRQGDEYVQGHVDKACLEVTDESDEGTETPIGLMADLIKPYAVFLRN